MSLNKHVDFSTAKLLKEKKIKIDTEEVLFYRDEINNIEEHQIKNRDVLYNYTGFGDYITDENEYQTYRIAEVVMWLYEKHGIWIQGPFPYNDGKWEWVIFLLKEPLNGTDGYKNIMSLHHHPYKFNSPTEAYEAAIKYCLEKII